MLSRRAFFRLFGGAVAAGAGLFSYAFAIEPRFRLDTTKYAFTPPGWPKLDRPLRIAALADIHACDPWMSRARIDDIVQITNALKPDLTVLLGDYVAGMRHFRTGIVPMSEWSAALAKLSAPLGVYAVLGNHDWWTDAQGARKALTDNGIPVLENQARKLKRAGGLEFWLAGLGDQLAFIRGRGKYEGVHDLGATFRQVTDDAPVILLAHEPDIFPEVSRRVSLTLSGHTHGGQVRLPLFGSPVVPSRFGQRFAYGHIIEDNRHLVVSGGLGCSIMPVRFGVPPEIVLLELG